MPWLNHDIRFGSWLPARKPPSGRDRGVGPQLLSGLSPSVPSDSELAAQAWFLAGADPASEVLVPACPGTFVITL